MKCQTREKHWKLHEMWLKSYLKHKKMKKLNSNYDNSAIVTSSQKTGQV